MEAAGEIRPVKSHSVAIPRDIFRNHCNQRNQCNQCNQRNQSVASTLHPAGQITRGEEPCPSTTDYGDYSDYADESISTHVSNTHSISPPLAGASLRNPAASADLPSEREDLQDAQDPREVTVISVISVINRCLQQHKLEITLSSVPQHSVMIPITLITLITFMRVFHQTGPRRMNLILHRQVLLYSTHQLQKIYSLREKTCKALKIFEMLPSSVLSP